MGNATLRGTTDPQLQRTVIRSDPSRGLVEVSEYLGCGTQKMVDLANQYIFDGVQCDLTTERGVSRLVASDSTLDNPIDVWELDGNSERKDLFQNPLWGNLIDDDSMASIRDHLQNNDNPSLAFSAAGATGGMKDLTPLAGTAVQRAYARYQAGNQEFENDAYGGGYTLRHITNVPARWTRNVADFGVGEIYSTAQLISEISSSSLWVYPCPPRMLYKINNIPIPTLREYFQWGWKKSRSREVTSANNRVNIEQFYVLELWTTDDYTHF